MPQEKKNPLCKNFILVAKILFSALHHKKGRPRPPENILFFVPQASRHHRRGGVEVYP